MRIVDLSIPVDETTPVYPGDPPPRLNVHTTIEASGFNLLHVSMGSQTGTHADAPFHFASSGATIDDVPLERFLGPAVVVDVQSMPTRTAIGPHQLDAVADRLVAGVIVVFHTGWAQHRGSPRYLDHPFLAPATCEALLTAGVRTVGIDAFSVDETPAADHPASGFAAHHVLAAAEAVIIENLTGLEGIAELLDPWIAAFPIKLSGADGAPVRAVAMDLPGTVAR